MWWVLRKKKLFLSREVISTALSKKGNKNQQLQVIATHLFYCWTFQSSQPVIMIAAQCAGFIH